MKTIDTHEARAFASHAQGELSVTGARCPKRQGQRLAELVLRLADGLDAARHELREARDYQRLYGALVEDYNGLIGAMRDLGIEVAQGIADAPGWRWTYGELWGVAPTVADAFKTALIVAGVDAAEPGAEWAAARSAALASAREVSADG